MANTRGTAVVMALGLLLAAASLTAGEPARLPALALGAVWLLYLERVVLGALAICVVVAIGVRLARGEIPLKLSATSVEFEALKQDAFVNLEDFELELRALRRRVDHLDEPR